MSILSEIAVLVQGAGLTIHTGYPPTGAKLPYTVQRELSMTTVEVALAGVAVDWDRQTTLYACGGSAEASSNLAIELMRTLQGARVGGTTLTTSMGYNGLQVEGHYESQVTVQLNQGGI